MRIPKTWPRLGSRAVPLLIFVLLITENAFNIDVCAGSSEIDQVPFFVQQSYRDIVKRAADPAGETFHVNQIRDMNARVCRAQNPLLASGDCEWRNNAQVVVQMLGSAESISKNGEMGSNTGFVTALYKTLLGRMPDEPGLRAHVRSLDSGATRLDLVLNFMSSEEYRNRFNCSTQTRVRAASLPSGQHAELGINGHPLRAHGVYSQAEGVSFDEQLTQVKDLGADWYRFDIGITATGQDFSSMDLLLKKAQEHNVKLLPVLFPSIDPAHDSLATIQQKSHDAAVKFASHYKGAIEAYELSNEQDVYSASGAPNGDQVSDYDAHKFGIVAAMMTGLAEGVHEADGSAKRIIDFAGWLHVGFFQRIEDAHVPYDIVGVHWYQNMGEITCPGQAYPCPGRPQHFNVLQRLQSITHGKPMWMTETNYSPLPNASAEANTQRREQYLVPTLQRYLQMPNIYPFQVVMIYELLDEPNVGGGAEQTQVGLVSVNRRADGKYSIGTPKPTYQAVQRIFKP